MSHLKIEVRQASLFKYGAHVYRRWGPFWTPVCSGYSDDESEAIERAKSKYIEQSPYPYSLSWDGQL